VHKVSGSVTDLGGRDGDHIVFRGELGAIDAL
jgi:hypothetical protein